jgi:acyl dehydratase
VTHSHLVVARTDGIGMAVNFGRNKVRFPAPVPVGSKTAGSRQGDPAAE